MSVGLLVLSAGAARAASSDEDLLSCANGPPEQAVAACSALLRLDPQFGQALADRGAAYAKLRNYQAAFADDSRALRLDPSASARWAARCRVEIKLAANAGLSDSAELRSAQADCAQALALDAGDLEALNAEGLIQLMTNDPMGALTRFLTVLAANPNDAAALFGRGLAKRVLGDSIGGEADMSAARGADPQAGVDYWETRLNPNP